jgi:hypothetical protein
VQFARVRPLVAVSRIGAASGCDGDRAFVAQFGILWFLRKCCRVQDHNQDKQKGDSHRSILPPNLPESYLIPSR